MFPPPSPWRQVGAVDLDKQYVGFTSRFHLGSVRDLPGFVTASRRIAKQVRTSPGLVGWSLAADLPKLEFHTLSAWEDEESLQTFLSAAPHSEIMQRYGGRLRRTSVFVQFPVSGRALPLTWPDAISRQVASSE
jgi:heme-degrading monooxygenase HmoA